MITSAWLGDKPEDEVWGEVTMHHNGDFSGVVEFVLDRRQARTHVTDDDALVTVQIPFEAIKSLVAEYVQARKVEELETATNDELLLGLPRPGR